MCVCMYVCIYKYIYIYTHRIIIQLVAATDNTRIASSKCRKCPLREPRIQKFPWDRGSAHPSELSGQSTALLTVTGSIPAEGGEVAFWQLVLV